MSGHTGAPSQGGKMERLFGRPSDTICIDNFKADLVIARITSLDRARQMMELEG